MTRSGDFGPWSDGVAAGTKRRAKGASLARFLTLAASMIVLLFMTMPLERGFPAVPMLGVPVSLAVIAPVGLLYCIVVLTRRFGIFTEFNRPYALMQTVYFALLIAEFLWMNEPMVVMTLSARVFVTFNLVYITFIYLIKRYGDKWLVSSVTIGATIASLVMIAEGIAGGPIQPYRSFFDSYNSSIAASGATAGVMGTMGNPILSATLLMLAFPFVMRLRSPSWRYVILGLIAVAEVLTFKRTLFVGIAVYGIAAIVLNRRRMTANVMWTMVAICAIIGLTTMAASTPLVSTWLSRLGALGFSDQYAAMNIDTRQKAVAEALNEIGQSWGFTDFLFGRGALSVVDVGSRVSSGYNTIDNAFVAVFYEHGLLGFALFFGSIGWLLLKQRWQALKDYMWYAPLVLLLCGFSFDYQYYTMFNLVAVGAMVLLTIRGESEEAVAHESNGGRYRLLGRPSRRHSMGYEGVPR